MSTTDTLSEIRHLLYSPPHRDRDREVCDLLASAPPELRPVALDYARYYRVAPWERFALTGSEEPVGWEMWARHRGLCELVPKKVCGACGGLGSIHQFALGPPRTSARCTRCQGTGVEIPPMLVWRTPLTWRDHPENRDANWHAATSPDLPITSIPWFGALEVCNKLSNAHGLKWAYTFAREGGALGDRVANVDGFRLPTVAQWQHLAGKVPPLDHQPFKHCDGPDSPDPCRGCGGDWDNLDDYAWHAGNSDGKVHPVGLKAPNKFGLYDVWGNVWEWCWDAASSGDGYNDGVVVGGSYAFWSPDDATREPVMEGHRGRGVSDVGLRPVLPLVAL